MQFSLVTLSSAVVTAMTITAGAVWYERQSEIETLKQRIESYKDAKALPLAALAKETTGAVIELRAAANAFGDLNALKNKNQLLTKTAKELNTKLETSTKTLAEKNSALEKLDAKVSALFSVNQRLVLEKNKPIKLFKGDFIISVSNYLYSYASLYINNKNYDLSIGKYIDLEVGAKYCKLLLEAIDRKNEIGTFEVTCE